MFDYKEYRIFLSCGKTDMRKSINGLCDIVQFKFELDPREKMIFVFCNQSRNRMKLLVWEDNGFWLHFKRLEKGCFDWPDIIEDENKMNLCYEDLINLIKAPGIKQKIKRKEVWKIS
ncbi:MAG: IS66 family insertion sequence element accessory protein TnpB [Anaerocolumna sp.]